MASWLRPRPGYRRDRHPAIRLGAVRAQVTLRSTAAQDRAQWQASQRDLASARFGLLSVRRSVADSAEWPSGVGCYGWSMSTRRPTAAAMAVRSLSSELMMRSPRRKAPSTTLVPAMPATRARPARVPVALALVSSRVSVSHPARRRAGCAWRGASPALGYHRGGDDRHDAAEQQGAVPGHIRRSLRSAAISAPESQVTPVMRSAGWRPAG